MEGESQRRSETPELRPSPPSSGLPGVTTTGKLGQHHLLTYPLTSTKPSILSSCPPIPEFPSFIFSVLDSPFERLTTTQFISLGKPLALWSFLPTRKRPSTFSQLFLSSSQLLINNGSA